MGNLPIELQKIYLSFIDEKDTLKIRELSTTSKENITSIKMRDRIINGLYLKNKLVYIIRSHSRSIIDELARKYSFIHDVMLHFDIYVNQVLDNICTNRAYVYLNFTGETTLIYINSTTKEIVYEYYVTYVYVARTDDLTMVGLEECDVYDGYKYYLMITYDHMRQFKKLTYKEACSIKAAFEKAKKIHKEEFL